MKPRSLKLLATSVAYIPMAVLIIAYSPMFRHVAATPVGRAILFACAMFDFPAVGLIASLQTAHPNETFFAVSALLLLISWSSLVAWFFWRIVGTFLGEDEPPALKGQYDWVGFRVRFVIGFILGFLFGWRFVKTTHSKKVVLVACFVSGLVGGFIYGISRPPDFWTRT
jgi:hypothetical protein